MLILSRKAEQSIQIGNVWITVLGIEGSRVKIGIEAPSSVSILRGELDAFTDQCDAEQEEAEQEEEVFKRHELAVA